MHKLQFFLTHVCCVDSKIYSQCQFINVMTVAFPNTLSKHWEEMASTWFYSLSGLHCIIWTYFTHVPHLSQHLSTFGATNEIVSAQTMANSGIIHNCHCKIETLSSCFLWIVIRKISVKIVIFSNGAISSILRPIPHQPNAAKSQFWPPFSESCRARIGSSLRSVVMDPNIPDKTVLHYITYNASIVAYGWHIVRSRWGRKVGREEWREVYYMYFSFFSFFPAPKGKIQPQISYSTNYLCLGSTSALYDWGMVVSCACMQPWCGRCCW